MYILQAVITYSDTKAKSNLLFLKPWRAFINISIETSWPGLCFQVVALMILIFIKICKDIMHILCLFWLKYANHRKKDVLRQAYGSWYMLDIVCTIDWGWLLCY